MSAVRGMPDPRPPRRVRDPELLRQLHLVPVRACSLDPDHPGPYSLHHIHKHPRDDVRANLIWLCGSGTTGCHGLIENHDPETMGLLVQHIRYRRPDTFAYLTEKLGSSVAADEWLRSQMTQKIGT